MPNALPHLYPLDVDEAYPISAKRTKQEIMKAIQRHTLLFRRLAELNQSLSFLSTLRTETRSDRYCGATFHAELA
jgi:hypothetical protein